jgi:hypothetical protein
MKEKSHRVPEVSERALTRRLYARGPRGSMATACISQLRFKFAKRVVAKFDAVHASADGAAVLLTAIDDQLGVTATRIVDTNDLRREPPRLLARLRPRHRDLRGAQERRPPEEPSPPERRSHRHSSPCR